MSIMYENHCVGCPQGCINCGRKHAEVYKCDSCGSYAEYRFEGEDLCEDCAEDVLVDKFRELTISDMARMLDVYCKKCYEI
jgi:hypothetical protein